MKNGSSQRGSVLFYILIAVALFAALSYAVANIMKSGNPALVAEEKTFLMADELLNFGRAVRQGVQTMKISNGCADTAISFENNFVSGYAHTPAASAGCQIFNTAGGNVQYVIANKEWLDKAFEANPAFGYYAMVGDNAFDGIGSANADLVLVLPFIKSNLCAAINKKMGNTVSSDPLPEDGMNATVSQFTGTYSVAPLTPGSAGTATKLRGKMAGGLENTAGGPSNVFYQVLIAR